MTRGPIRLRDDPAFAARFPSVDLADDELLVGSTDLTALKASVSAKVAAGAAPTTGATIKLTLVKGGLAVVASAAIGAAAQSAWRPKEAAVRPVPTKVIDRPVAELPEAPEPVAGEVTTSHRPSPRRTTGIRRATPRPKTTAAEEVGAPSIAEELASYEAARASLVAGRLDEARERFEAHRVRFPEGVLFDEAGLGLLEVRRRADLPEEAP